MVFSKTGLAFKAGTQVSVKNDNQKEAFIRTMIGLYLSNTTDANALFATLVAHDKVMRVVGNV
jgi:hypothetical protein